MPAGRPTKLTPLMLKRARDYLTDCAEDRVLLPTIEGMALTLGISRDTVYEWEGENEQFSDIVEKLRAAQGERLIQYGLQGRYNASIAKLILSGKHGYVEKSATDLTTNGKELPAPILGGTTKAGDELRTNDSD